MWHDHYLGTSTAARGDKDEELCELGSPPAVYAEHYKKKQALGGIKLSCQVLHAATGAQSDGVPDMAGAEEVQPW